MNILKQTAPMGIYVGLIQTDERCCCARLNIYLFKRGILLVQNWLMVVATRGDAGIIISKMNIPSSLTCSNSKSTKLSSAKKAYEL